MQAQIETAELLSKKYINEALTKLKHRLHYAPKQHKENAIRQIQIAKEEVPDTKVALKILEGRLWLVFSDKYQNRATKPIEQNPNHVFVQLEEPSHLDSYTLQLLAWLKKTQTKQQYFMFFSSESHVSYIKHYIETIQQWILAEEPAIKIVLVVPETTKNLYQSAFSQFLQAGDYTNQEDLSSISAKWQNFSFTEKAILITTCFLQGLSLHQFRQVISQILKVKDQLEEKDKTDRKMQGFYMAKWEKNYDQILRNCQLRPIKNEGQPAYIGFENLQQQRNYTQFIEEEYPIFLQEFFEMLLHAVFPKLCEDYPAILKACVSMYARLASHYKDYSQNQRPVELMVSLLNKVKEQENKENLAAQLINELCLHSSVEHLANNTFHLLQKETLEQITFLNKTAQIAYGQTIDFSLPLWLGFLKSQQREIQNTAFRSLLNCATNNTSQLNIISNALKAEALDVYFQQENEPSKSLPVYPIFLLYYSVENAREIFLSEKNAPLPSNLLLVQGLSFKQYKINTLVTSIDNLFNLPKAYLQEINQLKAAALLTVEWFISLHCDTLKNLEHHFEPEASNLLKMISAIPFLAKPLNKKRLISQWQEIAHELLILAKEIPHSEYQQLMALNTKRKIIIKLINNFRNL